MTHARYWLQVPTEIKNRGPHDVLMVVCDGLKGHAGRDRADSSPLGGRQGER
jgi:Transposase, Mutator family